ncbi:FIST C-terminal domain-containing protein [Eubacteriales bacterium OttesenSCG-928-A19]|nr:FIST C-terminal domain-containing protein [Eubacteriales bacterium OttesenSCG-928-A19]
MLTMLTAYTLEADDKDYALQEILSQLDLEKNMRKNAAGVLICHSDFIATGVAQGIAEKLPFDVVGCTSLASMASGVDDALMLSVAVFTSDDIRFSAFSASDLAEATSMEKAYSAVKLGEKPSLVIPFVPLLVSVAHEQVMLNLDQAIGGVPIFGSVAADHTADYSTCYTIFNGVASQSDVSVLLFWGEVDLLFCYSEMSERYIQRQRAVITKSQGNMLMEVNNMPLMEYLETIGVTKGRGAEALGGVPFLIDFGDGTHPVARGIHTITPEGYALCGGLMPENATLAIGSVERDDVLHLTRETINKALAKENINGILLHPCASHFLVLGADSQEQKDIIKSIIPEGIPYLLCYSGGEICPAYDKEGQTHNRFHSYTFTACVF